MTVTIPRQSQEQHKLDVCCCEILTSNDERESDAFSSVHIIVRQIERKLQMKTRIYTVFYR